MRKSQSQPSLASLSEADREQLAEWLRREEYHSVLAQVNRPRPDGFGLTIKSDRPLRTFYAKVALLDVINARLPENKKIPLALFESLARRDIYLLTSADNERLADAHAQILRTTADLASDGENTPAQLLTLQRLADFPARAALRQQMAEIQAERLELQSEREERLKAMQAHKIAMDLRKEERAERKEKRSEEAVVRREKREVEQSERAAKRLELSGKRLRLSVKSLAFRRRQHRDRAANSQRSTLNAQLASESDHLGPYAADLEGIRDRARKHFGITPEESARRAELRRTWKDPNAHLNPAPNLSGEAKDAPQNGWDEAKRQRDEAPTVTDVAEPTSISRDAIAPICATPANPHPEFDPSNSIHPSDPVEKVSSSTVVAQQSAQSAQSAPSTQHLENSSVPPTPLSPSELAAAVDAYTVRRADEYWSHRRFYSHPPRPYTSHPEYITEYRHCPCGQGTAATPCPIHESEEFGPFPNFFWKLSPHSVDYSAALRERNLPYRNPTEFI